MINASNLAPTQEARNPLSAQKVKPLYQLKRRDLMQKESFKTKK